MVFVHETYAAIILVTLTVVMQSVGMAFLIQWARAHLSKEIRLFGPVRSALLVVRFASLIVCLHLSEILLWAWFYRWKCFANWESAFYFSATSYSTVGYGDLVLQQTWRVTGPLEGLTGVLMCGLSASLLFAIVTRLVERDQRAGSANLAIESSAELAAVPAGSATPPMAENIRE
jgi:voltage-gated potassium channel